MRIGILTFHRSINYGAVTQCYCLATALQRRLPNDTVEVIDYVPQSRVEQYEPSLSKFLFGSLSTEKSLLLNAKILLKQSGRLLFYPQSYYLLKTRYKAFEDSLKALPLSKESYRQNDAAEFCEAVRGKYDVIVVGSDCVWEWTTVPLPSAYYLHGDYDAVKVSYAASAGTDVFADLSEIEQKMVRKCISEFSYIGVRDTSTEYVVRQAKNDAEYHHNCDPTTLLDASSLTQYRNVARKRMQDAGITFTKPIVGVMGNEKFGKLARDIFGDSVQYVGLYVPNKYCDANLLNLEVLEWAAVFDMFDLTITTYFHGTMLSLVNHTPVLSFDYLPETDKQHTKLHELYDRLDLPGFYRRDKAVYTKEDVVEIGRIARELLMNPPKEKICSEIEHEAAAAESFFEYIQRLHEQGNTDR